MLHNWLDLFFDIGSKIVLVLSLVFGDNTDCNNGEKNSNGQSNENGVLPVGGFWSEGDCGVGSFFSIELGGESELLSHVVEVFRLVSGSRVGGLGVGELLVVEGDHLWDAGKFDRDSFGGVEEDRNVFAGVLGEDWFFSFDKV